MSNRFIEYHWDYKGNVAVDQDKFSRIARNVLKDLDLTFDHLALIFVDDEYLKELHGKYLNDLSVTDVITFDLRDEDSLDAEIYISVDTAVRVAEEIGVGVNEELLRYAIHGILHLAGFNDADDSERAKMKTEEDAMVDKYKDKLN